MHFVTAFFVKMSNKNQKSLFPGGSRSDFGQNLKIFGTPGGPPKTARSGSGPRFGCPSWGPERHLDTFMRKNVKLLFFPRILGRNGIRKKPNFTPLSAGKFVRQRAGSEVRTCRIYRKIQVRRRIFQKHKNAVANQTRPTILPKT